MRPIILVATPLQRDVVRVVTLPCHCCLPRICILAGMDLLLVALFTHLPCLTLFTYLYLTPPFACPIYTHLSPPLGSHTHHHTLWLYLDTPLYTHTHTLVGPWIPTLYTLTYPTTHIFLPALLPVVVDSAWFTHTSLLVYVLWSCVCVPLCSWTTLQQPSTLWLYSSLCEPACPMPWTTNLLSSYDCQRRRRRGIHALPWSLHTTHLPHTLYYIAFHVFPSMDIVWFTIGSWLVTLPLAVPVPHCWLMDLALP